METHMVIEQEAVKNLENFFVNNYGLDKHLALKLAYDLFDLLDASEANLNILQKYYLH